jgi:myosin heavy subunit
VATQAHLFGLAGDVLGKVIRDCRRGFVKTLVGEPAAPNACIILKGVSGAGKSQAAAELMRFFAEANQQLFPKAAALSPAATTHSLHCANTVLAAFGCARSAHNAASSRFCRYTKLLYSTDAQLVAVNINTFLLEKSRVVRPNGSQGQGNFIIFDQLLDGLQTVSTINQPVWLAQCS